MNAKTELDGVSRKTRLYGDQLPGVSNYGRSRWCRIKGAAGSAHCYHVMSRIVDGLEFLDEVEKEAMVILIWKMARFCKVRVVTYCVMGNHFHLLIEVPDHAEVISDFEQPEEGCANEGPGITNDASFCLDEGWGRLLKHLENLYDDHYIEVLRAKLVSLYASNSATVRAEAEAIRQSYLERIGDLSRFTKELKERFSKWYNHRRGRRGTLWQGKFRSVLVESDGEDRRGMLALRTMAAYIDLNPVRAGMVASPGEYRWSGFAAALRGSKRARRGLNYLMGSRVDSWDEDETGERYFQWMSQQCGGFSTGNIEWAQYGFLGDKEAQGSDFSKADERRVELPSERVDDNNCGSLGPELEQGQDVAQMAWLKKGALPAFSRGIAIGSAEYVEQVFASNRLHFSTTRRSGAKRIRYPTQEGKETFDAALFTLRDVSNS